MHSRSRMRVEIVPVADNSAMTRTTALAPLPGTVLVSRLNGYPLYIYIFSNIVTPVKSRGIHDVRNRR